MEDDVSTDIDIAMSVRREGLVGEAVPPGILTYIRGTAVGRLIQQIEKRSDAGSIGIGLELLKLGSKGVKDVSQCIDRIAAAAVDGKPHDVTLATKDQSGITLHCNVLPDNVAANKLKQHCELRKYSQKAPIWFGLVISPESAEPRFGLMLDCPWQFSQTMEAAVAKMPRAQPINELRQLLRSHGKRKKLGRNEKCYCGSGQKNTNGAVCARTKVE